MLDLKIDFFALFWMILSIFIAKLSFLISVNKDESTLSWTLVCISWHSSCFFSRGSLNYD